MSRSELMFFEQGKLEVPMTNYGQFFNVSFPDSTKNPIGKWKKEEIGLDSLDKTKIEV